MATTPVTPVTPVAEMIYKEGRKLNGHYFVIQVSMRNANMLMYRAYNPRSAQQCKVELSKDEVGVILGPNMALLDSDTKEDQAKAHGLVIDSLGFEDRLLASLTDDGELPPSPRSAAKLAAAAATAAAPATVASIPVVATPPPVPSTPEPAAKSGNRTGSPSGPLPPSTKRGAHVFRQVRRLHDAYYITTAKLASNDAKGAHVQIRAYSPSSAKQYARSLSAADVVEALADVASVVSIPMTLSAHMPVAIASMVTPPAEAPIEAGKSETEDKGEEGDGEVKVDDKAGVKGREGSDDDGVVYGLLVDWALASMGVEVETGLSHAVISSCKELKEAGNKAYLDKNYDLALAEYSKGVRLASSSLVMRNNRAAALSALSRQDEAIAECKKVVQIGRKMQDSKRIEDMAPSTLTPTSTSTSTAIVPSTHGFIESKGEESEDAAGETSSAGEAASESAVPPPPTALSPKIDFLTAGLGIPAMIAKAYARIGTIYMSQRKPAQAVNAFTLSLKEADNRTVRAHLSGAIMRSQSAPGAGAPKPPPDSLPDIEELLGKHMVFRPDQPLRFECTGCGECCRTADRIFLTPADLFRMTRAPNMGVVDATTTMSLRKAYPEAVKYTQKDMILVAMLRPVKSKDGHCTFAYPLYTENADGTGDILSFEECHSKDLAEYRPVQASEYNLTEEEETEALDADDAPGDAESDDDTDTESEHSGEDDEGTDDGESDGDSEPDMDANAVLNSYGKQALGCRFGPKHMPTMCASYPMARELAWADFWHEYTAGPEVNPYGPSTKDGTAKIILRAPDAATESKSVLNEGKFIVPVMEACEGFFEDGKSRTAVFGNDPKKATVRSIGEFVSSNELGSRWRDDDWFKGLIGSVKRSRVFEALKNVDMRLAQGLQQVLGRVWYDFDGLRAAKVRPFRSWARAKRAIETVTAAIVNASLQFASTHSSLDVEDASMLLEPGKHEAETVPEGPAPTAGPTDPSKPTPPTAPETGAPKGASLEGAGETKASGPKPKTRPDETEASVDLLTEFRAAIGKLRVF